MDVALLNSIILTLIFISVVWTIRIIIKKEYEHLLRTGLIILLLGGAFFYLRTFESDTITLGDVRNHIRDTLFPARMPNYVYHKTEGGDRWHRYTRYYFESPGPPLSLRLDPKTQYFHIKDIYSVNRILEYLELPKVKTAVPELASLTDSRNDINLYRWEDYPLGILTIERGICQDRDRLDSYQCIVNITIGQR